MQQTKPVATAILSAITSLIDRQATLLNSRDVKTVKFLIRVVDGEIQEPEVSIDLKRVDRR